MIEDEDQPASTGPGSVDVPDSSRSPSTLLAQEARESAIQQLSTAFAQDYLSAEEFEKRVTEVYKATSESALAAVTADLPAAAEPKRVAPARAMPGRVSSVLSDVQRGGSLVVPAELELRSTMGNIVLDLRQARFQEGITEIHVRAIMGNIELYLPEDLYVECHGRTSSVTSATGARGAYPTRGKDRTGWFSSPVGRSSGVSRRDMFRRPMTMPNGDELRGEARPGSCDYGFSGLGRIGPPSVKRRGRAARLRRT